MSLFIDITGEKLNMWTVVKRVENNKNGGTMWLCQCECGEERVVFKGHLLNGSSTNCGCVRKITLPNSVRKHGRCRSDEYVIWSGIINRCENFNSKNYRYYGGRGITMCEEWRKDFKCFLSDMGVRPSKQHSIDRIDVNGNYHPNNCRWATKEEQARNQRLKSGNISGKSGVSWDRRVNKWCSRIRTNGSEVTLGYFESLKDATDTRKQAEQQYWTEAPLAGASYSSLPMRR